MNFLGVRIFPVFAGTSWPEYMVVDEPEKAPCFNNFGGNTSELSVVHGQNKSDDMLSLMDEFEVFVFLLCVIIFYFIFLSTSGVLFI